MKGKFEKILIVIAVFITALAMPSAVYASGTSNSAASTAYSLMDYSDRYSIFTNYVQGYELYIDSDLEIDASNMDVVTAFENESKRIEIYKQDISVVGTAGYINYSNKFLTNTPGFYFGVSQWTEQCGGYEVNITAWSRNALSRVENDKNNYLCIEIPQGRYVYTVFIKSADRITSRSGYAYLIENFGTFTPTKKAPSFKAEVIDIEDKGWNDETIKFYKTYFGEEATLTWGIFEPEVDYSGFANLDRYEEYFEYEFPVLLSYGELQNTSVATVQKRLEEAYSRGKVLELTIQTTWTENGNMVYDILNGKYDAYLYDYANAIADFGHPVLFRLFNEMNGDWCPYSSYNTSKDTVIFREAYKYIYGIFEECGANENSIWIWNPNSVSFPNFEWNHSLMYYPGDEYVDIIGLTAYNTGTYYPGEKWSTFTELYSQLYNNYSVWFEQPFMITEFASSSTGGDKVEWMNDMFGKINGYSRIKLAIWWDGADKDAYGNIARSYYLDESKETLDAFKKGIQKPWFFDVYA